MSEDSKAASAVSGTAVEALRPSSFMRIEGTTWPHPDDPNEIEWRLRYGIASRSDLLVAASYMAAYRYLISMTQRDRNHRVATIRQASRPAGAE